MLHALKCIEASSHRSEKENGIASAFAYLPAAACFHKRHYISNYTVDLDNTNNSSTQTGAGVWRTRHRNRPRLQEDFVCILLQRCGYTTILRPRVSTNIFYVNKLCVLWLLKSLHNFWNVTFMPYWFSFDFAIKYQRNKLLSKKNNITNAIVLKQTWFWRRKTHIRSFPCFISETHRFQYSEYNYAF